MYCIELLSNASSSVIKPIKIIQKSCFRKICYADYLTHCAPIGEKFKHSFCQ